MRHLPQSEWQVLIKEHHEGFIDWPTYEANQARLAANTRPGPHKVGGAVKSRLGASAGPGQLRPLRPAFEDALQRTQHYPWIPASKTGSGSSGADIPVLAMKASISLKGRPRCESAWNKDPVFVVIGIQSEPRG